MTAPQHKSTVDQIRQRFDADVERFANLDTGQAATIDAPLVMDLVTSAAAALQPNATHVLDVGCGAGNYTIKLLHKRPGLHCTLVDLSRPMLDRAAARLAPLAPAGIATHQADIRDLPLPDSAFDIILAAAVLHHLRTDAQWLAAFAKFQRTLRPGGCLFVADLVTHTHPAVQSLMWTRYGQYLSALKGDGDAGAAYRDSVFAYIDQEDTPRPLLWQVDLLRAAGFADVDILHKNSVFAAYVAIKRT